MHLELFSTWKNAFKDVTSSHHSVTAMHSGALPKPQQDTPHHNDNKAGEPTGIK